MNTFLIYVLHLLELISLYRGGWANLFVVLQSCCPGFAPNNKRIKYCFEGFPKSFVFELCDFKSTFKSSRFC